MIDGCHNVKSNEHAMKINRKTLPLLFLLSGLLTAQAQKQSHDVASSPYWRLLLHYKNTVLIGDRSEAAGPDFFFSPQGRVDPLAELNATLKAFAEPSTKEVGFFKQHPQCAFPERYRFLKQTLNLKISEIPCPEFQKWKKRLRPRAVSLIYASPYLGDAASMFGHSFLRLDSATSPLLDSGISFDALMGPTFDAGYVVKGVIGSYPGVFSRQPYYLKTHAYGHIESRDLWEYELALSNEQIDHLLNHLWELQNTYFKYYFFNGNCSYHLLSLLEVANPDWHLRAQFHRFAIPLETVRAVTEIPGAVRSLTERPSLIRTLSARVAAMSESDRRDFFSVQKKTERFTGHESAAVLDALLDWQQYQTKNAEQAQVDPRWIAARAKVAQTSSAASVPVVPNQGPRPDHGVRSTKVSLALMNENGAASYGLVLRPALHDGLDPDQGYIPFSSLLIAQLGVSYREDVRRARLDQFIFGKVVNLSPFTPFTRKMSWQLSAALVRPPDLRRVETVAGQIRGGVGLSFDAVKERVRFYGFVNAQEEFFRYGPSAELGTFAKINSRLRWNFAVERFWYFSQYRESANHFTQLSSAMSVALEPFEVRVGADILYLSVETVTNAKVSAGWFF